MELQEPVEPDSSGCLTNIEEDEVSEGGDSDDDDDVQKDVTLMEISKGPEGVKACQKVLDAKSSKSKTEGYKEGLVAQASNLLGTRFGRLGSALDCVDGGEGLISRIYNSVLRDVLQLNSSIEKMSTDRKDRFKDRHVRCAIGLVVKGGIRQGDTVALLEDFGNRYGMSIGRVLSLRVTTSGSVWQNVLYVNGGYEKAQAVLRIFKKEGDVTPGRFQPREYSVPVKDAWGPYTA